MISQFEVGLSVLNRHVQIQTSGLGRLRKCPQTMPLYLTLSMVLPLFVTANHDLEPLVRQPLLSMQLCLSCLNGYFRMHDQIGP